MADDLIGSALDAINSTGLGSDILGILRGLKMMPQINQTYTGQGTSGDFNSDTNTVQVSSAFRTPGSMDNTLSHELTHAVYSAIGKSVWPMGDTPSAVDPTTLEQLTKFGLSSENYPMHQLIAKAKPNDIDYRASYNESNAFGVGNSLFPTPRDYAVPHADATKAQETAIYLDLFKRGLIKKAQSNGN